jgi:hypothetical protein
MDLYLIAHIALTVGLLAGIAAALLNWIDGLRDDRARYRQNREALAQAQRELSERPRVRYPNPLPTTLRRIK